MIRVFYVIYLHMFARMYTEILHRHTSTPETAFHLLRQLTGHIVLEMNPNHGW